MLKISCTKCHQPFPESIISYQCLNCGGIFDYAEDLPYSQEDVDVAQPGIWRFQSSFGVINPVVPVSLGKGNTPLIEDRVKTHSIYLKLEYLNPTGSFKDRGSSILISLLVNAGVKEAVEDSSGNAGASFAAYTARAGIQGKVFIPASASGPKRNQIEAYGASVIPVPGIRSNAGQAAKSAAGEGAIYASHAYLPFVLPGYATIAYELFLQLGTHPGTIICPVGQGGLILGIFRCFVALMNANLIDEMPVLIAVQSRACAPLWTLAELGPQGLKNVSEGLSIAEGIRVLHPVRSTAVLTAIAKSRGKLMVVDEDTILPARNQLAKRGFYVEPTSAVVWPVLLSSLGVIPEPIILILTGTGLKYSGEN